MLFPSWLFKYHIFAAFFSSFQEHLGNFLFQLQQARSYRSTFDADRNYEPIKTDMYKFSTCWQTSHSVIMKIGFFFFLPKERITGFTEAKEIVKFKTSVLQQCSQLIAGVCLFSLQIFTTFIQWLCIFSSPLTTSPVQVCYWTETRLQST